MKLTSDEISGLIVGFIVGGFFVYIWLTFGFNFLIFLIIFVISLGITFHFFIKILGLFEPDTPVPLHWWQSKIIIIPLTILFFLIWGPLAGLITYILLKILSTLFPGLDLL